MAAPTSMNCGSSPVGCTTASPATKGLTTHLWLSLARLETRFSPGSGLLAAFPWLIFKSDWPHTDYWGSSPCFTLEELADVLRQWVPGRAAVALPQPLHGGASWNPGFLQQHPLPAHVCPGDAGSLSFALFAMLLYDFSQGGFARDLLPNRLRCSWPSQTST
jgi:hypothetical protein